MLFRSQTGCEDKKEPPKPAEKIETEAAETKPPEESISPPHLTVSESGPSVRGMSVLLTQPNGKPDAQGLEKLRTYLSEEKKFLEGKELKVAVDRKARPEWVATFLTELGAFHPAKIMIGSETRADFPKEIEFVAPKSASGAESCTLVGAITSDFGTAIWKLSGGTARKRGRGMGGPDLSMTADTILSMKKGCSSDLFVVGGAEGVQWGLVYDLAASGIALDKAELKRATITTEEIVPGNAVEL